MRWLRYKHQGKIGFGRLQNDGLQVRPYTGNLFADPRPHEYLIELDAVDVLCPVTPSKMIALWNNYRALADQKELPYPKTPLYLIKPPNTYLSHGEVIRHPESYDGKVFYEGELGIVIGRQADHLADAAEAAACIFGFTCINDVTAFDLLKEEDCFDQWTRAKGFDTFGVFGPTIATGLDFSRLEIVTRVDGEKVQCYPASDMILSPPEIVWRLSRNMSLLPGDIICCGTSVGLGPMKRGCIVEVEIGGIGTLSNPYR